MPIEEGSDLLIEDQDQRKHHGVEELEVNTVGIHQHQIIKAQGIDHRADNDGGGILHKTDAGENSDADNDRSQRHHHFAAAAVVIIGTEQM